MRFRQHILLKRTVPLLALAIGASCSSSTHPEGAALPNGIAAAAADFQTDSSSYTLRTTTIAYEGVINVTYTNRSQVTANFVNCRGGTGVELQKLVAGEWKLAWSPVLLLCLSPPIVVPNAGQHQFAIPVFGGYPESNVFPRFSVAEIPGTYRLVWTNVVANYQDRLPFGDPLPLEHRVSNQFTIQVQPR